LGDVEQFLAKAMEQPSKQSITEALVTLQGSNTIHSNFHHFLLYYINISWYNVLLAQTHHMMKP